MTRKTILKNRLEMAEHNLSCYSANLLCTTPKEGFDKEYKEARKEVEILKEWIEELAE